jgi:hypothetical protein
MPKSQHSQESKRRALRLTFDYDGDEIRLRDSRPTRKRVPASDPLLRDGEERNRSGFWIELTDSKQRPIWRRVLEDPRLAALEAPAEEGRGALERATVTAPKGSFRALLPDRRDARHVKVVASPVAGDSNQGPARILGSFELTTEKRGE